MSKQPSHKATGKRKRDDRSQSTSEQLTQAVRELTILIYRSQDDQKDGSRWNRRGAKWQITGVVVAVLGFFLNPVYNSVVKSPDRKTPPESKSAETITQKRRNTKTDSSLPLNGEKKGALRPSAPTDEDRRIPLSIGDSGRVGLRSALRGMTPFIGKKHYAVVTPPNGTDWVTPMSVGVDGELRGDPQFGEGSVGIGDSFIVRVLVTDSLLFSGKLSVIPGDAILSDPIVVTRQL
jgi:hypothetical protein